MKIIDISWPISAEMTAYKDKKIVAIDHIKTFATDHARETVVHLGSHSGTHIDAPAHFLEDGVMADRLPLHLFVGPCIVLDCMQIQERITAEDLSAFNITADTIVLFKTRNSLLTADAPFNPSFVYLDVSGAQYLVERKIKSVGIDYLGIERNQPNHATHVTLLQNSIGIIEGLRLQHVDAGNYMLWCLPLAIVGTEGVPARAVLRQP